MSTELQSNSVAEESTTLKVHRADWEAFQESCWESLTISQFGDNCKMTIDYAKARRTISEAKISGKRKVPCH